MVAVGVEVKGRQAFFSSPSPSCSLLLSAPASAHETRRTRLAPSADSLPARAPIQKLPFWQTIKIARGLGSAILCCWDVVSSLLRGGVDRLQRTEDLVLDHISEALLIPIVAYNCQYTTLEYRLTTIAEALASLGSLPLRHPSLRVHSSYDSPTKPTGTPQPNNGPMLRICEEAEKLRLGHPCPETQREHKVMNRSQGMCTGCMWKKVSK
ncbi:hypothetical protein PTTW11_03990 [Pyrenophora teres f. teres]|uniref:Uncharacterized protein n=1 Tax=Pyrenophora teres f. teres TaxID=97479 RepID=A0A6S6VYD3_9PLEO|nr:hypothetical protein PTTW11_03990 [Pyrenophora teres f. teres]